MGEYRKTVLRRLESKDVDDYLVPVWERRRLKYPASCLEESERGAGREMVGLGMKEIYVQGRRRRRGGDEPRYHFVLCNSNLEVIYEGSFEQIEEAKGRPEYYEEYSVYYMSVKRNLQRLIADKIVVGYDMGAMLSLLRLKHRNFIQIGHLYPHGLGLPCMIKLKSLAFQILDIDISDEDVDYEGYDRRYMRRPRRPRGYRHWGNQDLDDDSSDYDERRPRRRSDDEDSEDNSRRPKQMAMVTTHVNVCLQLAKDYIEKGSGVFTNVESTQKDLRDVDLMLEEAEIDRSRIVGLFLRGSRAVGVEIELGEYFSDWDYVCVIDTTATIYSSLVKLHNVDLILFDKKTFEMFIGQNDLPMLELFYLPPQCIIINHFPTPFTILPNLKKSLAYHIKKTDVKLVHYGKEFLRLYMHPARNYSQAKLEKIGNGGHGVKEKVPQRGRGRGRYEQDYQQLDTQPQGFVHQLMAQLIDSYPESKLKPQYVKWKLLKLVHLEIRMVDEYLQYKEFNCIKDIKRVTPIWKELLTVCNEKDHYSGYKFLKAKLNELLEQAFSFKELYYFDFTVWVDLQKQYEEQNERRFQSYRNRRYRIGVRGPYTYRPVPEMGEAMLSIYKGNIFQSSVMGRYKRIDYIDDRYEGLGQEIERRDRQKEEEPTRQIVSMPPEFGAKKALLGLAEFIEENEQISQSNFQHHLSPYFIKTKYFFENSFIGQLNKDQDNLKQEIICLNTFKLQQHANLQNKLVREAKSAIYKTYQTVMREIVIVKTLVCLNYLPFYEYSHHLDKETVQKFQDEWCSVEPKLDGVSATLYYVDCGWLVASKQSPDGRDFILKDSKVTFKEEFLRIFNTLGFKLPEEGDRSKAFFFEMLSTNISNVLPKEKDGLILHGVRNMSNLEEELPKYYAEKYGWQFLHTEDLNTRKLDEIAKIAQERENFEGFVLKNKKFERLVIRNSAFLKKKWEKELERLEAMPQYSFLNEKIEENRLVYFIYSEIVLKGWEEVYVKLFPQNSRIVQSILSYIKQVNEQCQQLLKSTADIKQKSKQFDDTISNKRADILEYSFGSFNKTFPDLYKSRIHTSVHFDKTFNFILQHLNQLSNQ